jgi:hypothetical protein
MSKSEFFSGPVTDATRCNRRGIQVSAVFQATGACLPQINFTEAEAFLAPGNEAPRPLPRKLKICLTYHVILATSCHDLGL